ncbi:hypothetical protein ABK040_004253 [Willaertia magna]
MSQQEEKKEMTLETSLRINNYLKNFISNEEIEYYHSLLFERIYFGIDVKNDVDNLPNWVNNYSDYLCPDSYRYHLNVQNRHSALEYNEMFNFNSNIYLNECFYLNFIHKYGSFIKSMEFNDCAFVTDLVMKYIKDCCPNLEELKVNNCMRLSVDFFKLYLYEIDHPHFTTLKTITITNCKFLNDDRFMNYNFFFACFKNLKEITYDCYIKILKLINGDLQNSDEIFYNDIKNVKELTLLNFTMHNNSTNNNGQHNFGKIEKLNIINCKNTSNILNALPIMNDLNDIKLENCNHINVKDLITIITKENVYKIEKLIIEKTDIENVDEYFEHFSNLLLQHDKSALRILQITESYLNPLPIAKIINKCYTHLSALDIKINGDWKELHKELLKCTALRFCDIRGGDILPLSVVKNCNNGGVVDILLWKPCLLLNLIYQQYFNDIKDNLIITIFKYLLILSVNNEDNFYDIYPSFNLSFSLQPRPKQLLYTKTEIEYPILKKEYHTGQLLLHMFNDFNQLLINYCNKTNEFFNEENNNLRPIIWNDYFELDYQLIGNQYTEAMGIDIFDQAIDPPYGLKQSDDEVNEMRNELYSSSALGGDCYSIDWKNCVDGKTCWSEY